jgi:tetratricopeptide (TPR) repeat protein
MCRKLIESFNEESSDSGEVRMTLAQWKLVYMMAFLSLPIAGAYAIVGAPLPRLDITVWAVLFIGWVVIYKSSVYKRMRADVQQIYQTAILIASMLIPLYFFVRLILGPFIAIGVVGLITAYYVCFQLLGTILIIAAQYNKAHQYLDIMIKLFPNQAQFYTKKAYAYWLKEDHAQVIAFATRAIDLRKKNKSQIVTPIDSWTLQAYNFRVFAHLNRRDELSALPDANVVVKASPQDPQAYINRGRARLYLGEIDAAKTDLEHAVSISVLPFQIYLAEDALGALYHHIGNYEEAMTHYVKAAQTALSPEQRPLLLPLIYSSMAGAHFVMNNRQAAWQAIRTANDINPKSMDTRIGLAVLYAADEAWNEAVEIWGLMVAEDPRYGDITYLQARYFFKHAIFAGHRVLPIS